MYQKDYILRMIEMMAELIAGILGLIKKGDYKKASESLNDAYFNVLREDASFFKNIPTDHMPKELIEKHNYSNGHLEILSELFFAEAELEYSKSNSKYSLECYQKSLTLLEFVIKKNKTFSLYHQERILNIRNRIEELKKI